MIFSVNRKAPTANNTSIYFYYKNTYRKSILRTNRVAKLNNILLKINNS